MYIHCTSMRANLNCTCMYNVRTLYVQCPLGSYDHDHFLMVNKVVSNLSNSSGGDNILRDPFTTEEVECALIKLWKWYILEQNTPLRGTLIKESLLICIHYK